MDGRFSDIELLFIKEVLDQHGEYLSDLLTDQIESKKLIHTGALLGEIKYKVTSYGINPVLQVIFPDYGRFIEIRYHKKSNNTSSWTASRSDVKQALWGRATKKMRGKKKKDTRWYAKTIYGSMNRLISILMNEFTDEEKTRLMNIMQNSNS